MHDAFYLLYSCNDIAAVGIHKHILQVSENFNGIKHKFPQDFPKNDEDYHKYVSTRIYIRYLIKVFRIYIKYNLFIYRK